MLNLIWQAVYYLKIRIYSIILAEECYIISFNNIDPFIFIFPFINSFLFGGWGGGYIFGRRINWGVSFGYGDFFWEGGYICNKFELVKKITVLLPPPLVIKTYSPLKYGMTMQLCSTIIKILLVTFCFIIDIWWVFWGMFKFIGYMFRA